MFYHARGHTSSKSHSKWGAEDQASWPHFPIPHVFVVPPPLHKRPPSQLLGFLVSFLQLPISKKSLHLSLSWPVLPFKHPGAIWVSCHSHTCGHFSGICLDASSLSHIKFCCPVLLNLTSEMYSFTSWLMQCPTKLQITAITTCFMLVLLFITRFLGCTVNIHFVNNKVFLHPVSFKSVIKCIIFSTNLAELANIKVTP